MLSESIRNAPLFTYGDVVELLEMAFGLSDEDELLSINQVFQALGFEFGTAVAVSVNELITRPSPPPWAKADRGKMSNNAV